MPVRRPRDRKQQILAAASELFRERGYHNVAVADVAAAVDITASALYRHYRNKNDLLYHAVAVGLDSLEETVGGSTDTATLIANMSASVSGRRGLPLLWQREARHLDPERREELRHRLRAITANVATLIQGDRVELTDQDAALLALCVLAVFSSVSAHRITLPRRRMAALLTRLADGVAHCPLGTVEQAPPAPETGVTLAVARREQLLTEAIRLFDERGYQSVNTEDIGEAAGTTGPNVYNYFDTKSELLVTAVTRGFDRREFGARQAVAQASDPDDALRRLALAHIGFALEDSHLIGLMGSELDQLPDSVRRACAQQQRDYIEIWVQVLDGVRPGLETAEARIAVSAAHVVIANAARTGRLRRRPDLPARLLEIVTAILIGAVDHGEADIAARVPLPANR